MKNKLLTSIISISFILCSFFGSVHFWCFNESFYKSEHEKIMLYGKHINEHIGISEFDLDKLTSFTLDYLNDPNATLDIQMDVNGVNREIYTDDEKAHMVDVRKLNLTANYLLISSTIILVISCFIYIKKKESIWKLLNTYKKTLIFTLLLFSLIGFWILVDFDEFWTFFHKIFFAGNDLWLLDLRKDILIMIVPPEFFNHLVIRIVLTFVICIITFGLLLYLIYKRRIEND